MSAPAIANVLKSNAVMWVAPTGEALPDETSVDHGGTWGGNWERVGFTKEPLKIKYEQEDMDFHVEEYLGPVKRRKTGHSAVAETVLAELTAEYIALASGNQETITTTAAGASQKGFEEVYIGDSEFIDEKIVGFEGAYYDSSENAQPVRIFFMVATFSLNGELEFSKKTDNYVGVPVQVKALADTSDNGRLVRFQRVTAPATS